MKLSVHFISGGRCYHAGDEIPDEQVPPSIAKYMLKANGEPQEPVPAPPRVNKAKAKSKPDAKKVPLG